MNKVLRLGLATLCWAMLVVSAPLYAQKNDLMVNIGHYDHITAMDMSRDGRWLITTSLDRSIRVWDYPQKKLYKVLHGFTYRKINALKISPDGIYIAAAGNDQQVRVWKRSSGELVHTINSHTNTISTLAFSPDGKTLASGGRDSKVVLWDIDQGTEITSLRSTRENIATLAFSSDGRWLVTGTDRGSILIWQTKPRKLVRKFTAYANSRQVHYLAISPDSKKIITAHNGWSNGTSLDAWDFATGKNLVKIPIKNKLANAFYLHKQGNVATIGIDRSAELIQYDMTTGKPLKTFKSKYTASALLYTPDEKHLVVGDRWNHLRIFDAQTRQQVLLFYAPRQGINHLDFVGDKFLISRYSASTLLWNGTRLISLENTEGARVYFAPDGKTSIGTINNKGYAIWDNATGKIITKYNPRIHQNRRYAALSPKATYYMELDGGKTVHLHKVGNTQAAPWQIIEPDQAFRHCSFSDDETKIALSGGNKTIELWDIVNKKRLHTVKGHYWGSTATHFFHKGDRFLSGGSRGNLIVWNIASGQMMHNLKGHKYAISAMRISSKDQYIATGAQDGELRLWDARNYKFLRKLNGHKAAINTLLFTQNNKKIISIADDGEIILWDTETGLRLMHAQALNNGKDHLFYTPDGQIDATAGAKPLIYRARNDSIIALNPTSNQFVKGLLRKVLSSQKSANNNVSSQKGFHYYDIALTNPKEPATKINKESVIKYQGESLIIKGKLKNLNASQISRIKVDGRRATLNRSDLTFTSRRISFVESPSKDVLIEVFTNDGNVTTRLLRIQATLTNVAQKPSLVVTKGHKSQVVSIDFHPKGKYLITASMDKTLKIWDRSLRQEFRTLSGHKQTIRKVIYSPNGKYIASCDRNEVILWRHPSGRVVKRFKSYYASVFFSSDSKKLFFQGVTPGSGFSGNLLVVDVKTGKLIKEYDKIDLDEHAALHPSNRYMFTKGKRWDLNSGEDLGYFEDGGQKLYAWTLSDVTQTHFAAYNIQKQQVQIWDITDPTKPVGRIPLPIMKAPKKMRFTNNGKRLLIGTTYYELLIYAVPTGRLIREIKVKKGMITKEEYDNRIKTKGVSRELGILYDFEVSPDDKMLALNAHVTSFGTEKKNLVPKVLIGVRFIAFKQGNDLGVFGGFDEGLSNFSVGNSEKYLISSHYGRSPGIRLWNLRKGQIDGFIPAPMSYTFSNGKQIVQFKAQDSAVIVYNIPSLKVAYTLKGILNVQEVYLSPNGNRLIYKTVKNLGNNQFDTKLNIWDVSSPKTPKLVRKVEARTTSLTAPQQMRVMGYKISPDDRYLLISTYETAKDASNSFKIKSIDLTNGKTIWERQMNTFLDRILDFVPDKPHVLISKIIQTPGNYKTQLTELNYTNGKNVGKLDTDYEVIFDAHFSADGKYLVTGSGGYWMPKNIYFDVAIWDWENKTLNCVLAGHAINIKHVWFGAKGKKVYSADENSIIKVWDISKCKLAASFLGLNDDDYIILNADNYYKTSKGSIDGIGFRYKGQLRSFGQFDLRFNRPDLVMKDLGASKIVQRIYYKAWKKRLRRAGMTEAMIAGEMHLPEVRIPNKFDLPPSTNKSELSVKIQASDKNVALKNLQVYVNDVPLYGKAGIPAKRKNELERTLKIKLNQGRNKVSVSAVNENGLESAKESFNIAYNVPKKKPRLFLLAIGVSEYEDNNRNLKFAQKDASNLADLLTKSSTYSDTVVTRILNKNATKANILKAGEMFKKTTVDDQVVIFISCHGLLDEKMDYYLATTDVDFADPSKKGLPYEAIEQMLDKIPARKRLIMIDACHSGELDKTEVETVQAPEVVQKKDKKITIAFKGGRTFVKPKAGLNNSFDYMKALFNDISNHSGATVISAAAGYEFALESKEWNNGVFTYSILNGIDSGTADLNNDGRVSVSELKDYVISQVAELTDGKQVPTTRRENQSVEVVIYEK
ncbi:MAG TPA: hypothetical protein DCS93_05075 [Microscillaceae bacterium]|nr:hypothetical protein [Microscillaceae bacterium]